MDLPLLPCCLAALLPCRPAALLRCCPAAVLPCCPTLLCGRLIVFDNFADFDDFSNFAVYGDIGALDHPASIVDRLTLTTVAI